MRHLPVHDCLDQKDPPERLPSRWHERIWGRMVAAVTLESHSLRKQLRDAGIASGAIDAVWPEWWSNDAESSLSAKAELRYTVARRLGLSPRSLFAGTPKFVWKDETKFKNLGTHSEQELAILSSFGAAVGQCALEATRQEKSLPDDLSAGELRDQILAQSPFVQLQDLLALAWAFGIPTLKLSLFPLKHKRMHAMTVRVGDRYAVLVGRESKFYSQIAYVVAHELGHILRRHLADSAVLVEVEDPLQVAETDAEEFDADRFALELLTGNANPQVDADRLNYTSTELAAAALAASKDHAVDPGVLALCLGHATGNWKQAFGALKLLPPGERDVGGEINAVAMSQLDWDTISFDNREFLMKVLNGSGD